MYACFAGSVFDSTRLRFSGAGAKKSVGHNNGIPGCHQCGTSRVTSGGKGPCMMATFTVSRNFMVTIVLSEMGTAVPHARHRPHAAAGVLWLCGPTHSRVALEFSTCAPTRMASAAASPLFMITIDNKQLGERCKQFKQIAKCLSHDKRHRSNHSQPRQRTLENNMFQIPSLAL